jgi:hypothetical protein
MNYAVLQVTLDVPAIEALKRAFLRTTFLRAVDAFTVANDAYGILVKNISKERALLLQTALREEGIETEVVAEDDLVPLPPPKFVNQINYNTNALILHDPVNRPFSLAWQHIALFSAGFVRSTTLKREPIVRHRIMGIFPVEQNWLIEGEEWVAQELDYVSKERRTDSYILDIFLTRAVLRYCLTSEHFLFQCLGSRRTKDVHQNFSLLMQDLTRLAPHAAVNRGTFYAKSGSGEQFPYRSKNGFYEETSWLLWQLKKAGKL